MINTQLKATGKHTHETLVIGDSVHDLQMASNAGVDSIGVTSGANTHDELKTKSPLEIFDCISQIKGLLK